MYKMKLFMQFQSQMQQFFIFNNIIKQPPTFSPIIQKAGKRIPPTDFLLPEPHTSG